MDGGIEQRPRLRAHKQRRHRSNHQIAVVLVFGRCFGKAARGRCNIDAAQGKDELLEGNTCKPPFLLATRYAGVLPIGIAFRQLAQFAADGIDRERDYLLIVCRNCSVQDGSEIVDLLEHGAGPVTLIGPHTVANRGEIGDQIALCVDRPRSNTRSKCATT